MNRRHRGWHLQLDLVAQQAMKPSPRRDRGGAVISLIRCNRVSGIEGRQAKRGGDSPQGFPLEASKARSATGAKA
ncbi:MAG: hypothetical protein LBF16_05245 [Pseudomonadales bacterium]|jgi:hypothetical protein|nr:hypothetical protein [Pseudomonadales bacterium]